MSIMHHQVAGHLQRHRLVAGSGTGPFRPRAVPEVSNERPYSYPGFMDFKITQSGGHIAYMSVPRQERKQGYAKKMAWTALLETLYAQINAKVELTAKHFEEVKLPTRHIHAKNGFQYKDKNKEYRYQQELEDIRKRGGTFVWTDETPSLFNGLMFLTPIGTINLLKKYGGGGVLSPENVKRLIQAIRISGASKRHTLPITDTLEYTQIQSKVSKEEEIQLKLAIARIVEESLFVSGLNSRNLHSNNKPLQLEKNSPVADSDSRKFSSKSHRPLLMESSLAALCLEQNHESLRQKLRRAAPNIQESTIENFIGVLQNDANVRDEVLAFGNDIAQNRWKAALPESLKKRWEYQIPPEVKKELAIDRRFLKSKKFR